MERDLPPIPHILGGGLILEGNISFIMGPAKLGKSIFVSNLALSLATGSTFLGIFPVIKPYRVLMFQQEVAPTEVKARFKSILTGFELPDNLHIVNEYGTKVDNASHLQKMLGLVVKLQPDVVILDPMRRYHGANEDSSQEMGHVLDLMTQFCQGRTALVVVHHTGKPSNRPEEDNKLREGGYAGRGSSVIFDYGAAYMTLRPTENANLHRLVFELRYGAAHPDMHVERNGTLVYKLHGVDLQDVGKAAVEIVGMRAEGRMDINNRIVRKGQFKLDTVQRAERWLGSI